MENEITGEALQERADERREEIPVIQKPIVSRKMCNNHDLVFPLMGEPCPNCRRLSLFAYDY